MEKSLFYAWLQNTWNATLNAYTGLINGRPEEQQYFHKRLLGKKFSLDLKWGSLTGYGRKVAADVVALDASVPLKKRASLQSAEGNVPKMGLKRRKSETEMQNLQTMQARNSNGEFTNQIIDLLYDDPKFVIDAIDERNEYMFLEGFSTGFATITESVNEGTAVRADYGYSLENKFGVNLPWSDDNAKPISDIEHIAEVASQKGRKISYMFMDRFAWNNFKNKAEVRELYAASIGFSGANAPTPNFEQANNALSSNGLPQVVLIDKSVTIEKNGIQTSVKPWAKGVVVFTDTLNVGDVVWSRLVEASNPKRDVLYAQVDDYKLVSIFHTNDPYSETTSGQALCIPVINNVDGIFVMDSEEADTDVQVEGDADYNYQGTDYTRTSVIAGLVAADPDTDANSSMTDGQLKYRINKLSEAQIALFEDELVASV